MNTAELLREHLREEIDRARACARILRGDAVGAKGFGGDETIHGSIVSARHDKFIANHLEEWARRTEIELGRARSIDDILVAFGGRDNWRKLDDIPLAELPLLTPEEQVEAHRLIAEGLKDVFGKGGEYQSWAEATGVDEPPPPNWTEQRWAEDQAAPDFFTPPPQPPEPPQPSNVKRGTGQQGGPQDPNDTVPPPGSPPERAAPLPTDGGTLKEGKATPGANRPPTIKDKAPEPGHQGPPSGAPERASQGSSLPSVGDVTSVVKPAAEVALAVAAFARRRLAMVRLLQLGGGGLVILLVLYGGRGLWGLWGSGSPQAGGEQAGQLEHVTINGTFSEAASTYVTTPITTKFLLTAGRHPSGGSVDIKLNDAATTFDGELQCLDQGLLVETRTSRIGLGYEVKEIHAYSDEVRTDADSGQYDMKAGTFSAPFDPRVVRNFNLTAEPFTDSRCTYMNDPINLVPMADQFPGKGTISGTVSLDSGSVTFRTQWKWGNGISMEGTFSGQGTVERY